MSSAALKLDREMIRWHDWVSLRAAADALGMNRDALGRKCRELLAAKGHAMQASPPDGGAPQWFVHRDYSPRLYRGRLLEVEAPPDTSAYTFKQIAVANARRRCVDLYRDAVATKPGKIGDWIDSFIAGVTASMAPAIRDEHGITFKVSRRTLNNWDRVYRGPADFDKLVDARGGDQRSQGDPAAWGFFKSLYLTENRMKAKAAWRMTREQAAREGWAWCNYQSCRRQLDERIPPAVQTFHRDKAAFRNSVEPTGELHPESFAANERWDGDHAELDIVCRVPGRDRPVRPWLTAWMDWRTRKVVGWVLSVAPSSTTIGLSLKRGIEGDGNLGPPAKVWIDNGKDYRARPLIGATKRERVVLRKGYIDESFTGGIFGLLSIEPHFAIPYNPRGKSRLERWFSTLHEHFDKSFFTAYCGNAPHTRPEHLNATAKDLANLPTLAEVEAALGIFIDGYNRSAEHDKSDLVGDDGRTLSPADALDAWGTRRVLAKPGVLKYLMLHRSKPVTVGKRGVRVQVPGVGTIGWGMGSPALIPYQRAPKREPKRVIVAFDPMNIRTAWVLEESGRVIAEVGLNHTGGRYGTAISLDQAKDAIRKRQAHRKALKLVATDTFPMRVLTTEELIAHEAATAPKPTRSKAAGLKIVQTPMDDQLAALQKGERRLAAGAESVTDGADDFGVGIDLLHEFAEQRRPRRSLSEREPCIDIYATGDDFDTEETRPGSLLIDATDGAEALNGLSPWSDSAEGVTL